MRNSPSRLVSIVIPSTGRETLARAISGVRTQTISNQLEIIVVFDVPFSELHPEAVAAAEGADLVRYTSGRMGASEARNIGVESASSPWIAFLDDDDFWLPRKLEVQLEVARQMGVEGLVPIVGCRLNILYRNDSQKRIDAVPNRLISPSQRIDEYLFSRRRPGAGRASFLTSTILAPTDLCRSVKWDSNLARHQDWDWLLRAAGQPKVAFAQAAESLVDYTLGSVGSISATSDWMSSFTWAVENRSLLTKRSFADFMCAQTLRYAFSARDFGGAKKILKEIWANKCIPSFGPIVIGAAGILSRRNIQRVMIRVR
ncbi:glycosyltransferase family A protein [Arthrobacter sp. Bz4]|uniref:glycosyltransferase family A protein n=1 Tax=Arthrobacter sp. Bz4 TaxID=2171979 RepID=UPI000D5226D8|nr:glycosyltransferase family A protein [Arthrobacter sp. Bz4]PVE14651.1 hypothetical protein DDA93_15775 [Arthrobacter sp. Bz4]